MDGDMVADVLVLIARLAGSVSSVCMLIMLAKVHVTLRRYQPILVPITRWQRAPPRQQRVRRYTSTLAVRAVVDRRGRWRCNMVNVHDERIRRRP